ncbi:hypothetical protein B5X24_HaOG212209 [Helicoverpa armigera]|nr:hypothetical protein B5X24_HaOG212209 [Helicoverpa armigera]
MWQLSNEVRWPARQVNYASCLRQLVDSRQTVAWLRDHLRYMRISGTASLYISMESNGFPLCDVFSS